MAIKKFNAVQGFSVGGDVVYDVIDNAANVTANNLTVSGTTNLGTIGNVTITGGQNGYILKTDGSGTLSWESPDLAGVTGANTQVQYNNAGHFGASANFTYNNSTKTLTVDNIVANGAGLTDITGANVTGTVDNANYAAYAGNITIAAQPNITSVGTLVRANITGNVSAGNANLGNLVTAQYFSGTLITGAQPNITSVGTLVDTTMGPTYSLTGGNLVSATYLSGTLTTKAQPNITSVGTLTTVRVTGNATAGNATLGNLAVSNYFSGDGSLLTNLDGTQVFGTVANANYAAYAGNITRAAQPNITSVGTLVDTTMGSANSLSGGNLVSATYLTGTLTTKVQPNITSVGTLVNTTMGPANSLTGGNLVSASYLTGTLTTNAQPNITSVGTLVDTTMGSTNSLSGGNLVSATYLTGTLTTKVQPNITSVGTLANLNVTGNITSGNNVIVTANVSAGNANLGNLVTASYFSGAGNLLSNIQGANVSGEVGLANIAWRVSSAAQPNITSVGTLVNTTMGASNSLTGGNLVSATYLTGTLTTKDQPNITSVGTLNGLSVNGDTSITGNLTVTGSVEIANVSTFAVKDPIIEQGGKTDGTSLTTNDHLDRGSLLHYYTTAPVDAFMGWDNSNAEFAFGSNVTVSGEIVQFNAFGNLRANYFFGNASQLVGTIANANYAAYAGNVTIAAQPNITSVGTLVDTTMGSSNSLTGGNLVSATYLTGTLTTKAQPNITSVGTLVNTTMGASNSLTGGNLLSATYLTGTLTTNAQPNITSVGTLVDTTMGSSNSLTGGNLVSATYLTGTLTTKVQPNITSVGTLVNTTMGASNSLTGGNLVSATYLTGTLTTNAQPNVTSVGTLANLNVTGNVSSGGNLIATANVIASNANLGNLVLANYFSGAGNLLSNIQGANVSGEVGLANIAWRVSSGAQPNITSVGTLVNTTMGSANSLTGGNLVSATYLTGTLTTNAQPNVTSVGTLVDTTMGSSNSLSGGNLVSATYLTGTLTTKVQPNITSVGTLVDTTMGSSNSLSGGNLVSATYLTGTLTTNAQPNITSVGTLTSLTAGDTTINGNLTVTGSVEIANVSTFRVKDPIIELGGKTDGSALTTSDPYDRGQLLHYYSGGAVDAFMGWDSSNAEFAFGSNVSVSGEVVSFNQFGNLRANYFFGNASQLVGTIANANYAAYAGNVTISAQPNITSVGTLVNTTMGSSNSLTGGNLVSATYLTGTLTTKVQPNITSVGTLVDTTMGSSNSLSGGNLVSATYLTGTLTTNAQPNVTSVGTLANLNVTGNISSAANVTAQYYIGNASALIGTIANANYAAYAGNVTIAAQPNITSVGTLVDTLMAGANSLTGGNLVSANYITGTLTTKVQPNITSVGTLANLNVTGNITASGNITAAYLIGDASLLTGKIENANYAAYAGNVTRAAQPNITSVGTLVDTTMGSSNSLSGGNLVSATYLTGTLTTNAQPNITSVGTLVNTTMGSSNSLSGGNLVSATYLTGTLTTKVQPNITSVGTLVDTVIAGPNSLTGANLVSANYFTGTLTTQAQPNITSVGTLVNTTMGSSNSLTGGNLVSATYLTGTLTTQDQPNVTSLGTLNGLNVNGDTTITGNLTVTGAVETANVSTFRVKDPLIEQGGKTNGTALTSNDGYDRGQILHYYSGGAVDAFMGWDNSNAEFAFGSNVSVTLEQVAFNSFGNVRANYFLGNASQLVGTIANANYAAYAGNVTIAAQPNITSVGTLVDTTMGASNSLTGGNLLSASYLTGTLTTKVQPNITSVGTLVNTTMGSSNSLSGGNLVSATYLTGTLTTNAQPNITSVGTLVDTTMGSSNSLSGGNLVSASYLTGTLTTKVQPNITSIGSLVGLTVSNSSGVVDFTTTANVTLGALSNLHISGGTSGYVLSTNGSGALSWTNPSTVGIAGSNTQVQFNDNGSFGASANFIFNKATSLLSVTGNVKRNGLNLMAFSSGSSAPSNPVAGDEWYDQANDIIYKYIFDGTSSYWVDSTSGYLAANVSNVANTMVLRDISGNVTATYFIGDGSLLTGVGSSGGIANGTSNIKAGTLNGNITVGIGGVSNTVIFTSTGMNVIATGGINAGNIVTANYFTGTLTTGAQPNITSVGTLVNTTMGSANSLTGGNLVSASYLTGTLTTGAQPNITSVGTLVNTTMGSSNSLTGGNLVSATYLSGTLTTGAQPNITSVGALVNTTMGASNSLTGGNLVSASYLTGTLTTGAQPNITSVGTLGNVTVTNTVTAGNVKTDNLLYANGVAWSFTNYSNTNVAAYLPTYTGTITAGNITVSGNTTSAYFSGNGSLLTGLNASNIASGTIPSSILGNSVHYIGTTSIALNRASGAQSLTGITSIDGYASTVSTNAQPNITSLGTLASLNVTANANVGTINSVDGNLTGNLLVAGNLTVGGAVQYVNVTNLYIKDTIIEQGGGANNAALTTNDGYDRGQLLHYYSGGVVDAFMGWDNSNAEFAFGSNVSVAANIVTFNNFGNIRANYFLGNASQLTGTIANANYAAYAANVTASAQPNITSVGTLASLTVSGSVTAGTGTGGTISGANLVSANYFTGTLTTGAQPNITSVGTLTSANVSGNISSAGNVTAAYLIGNGSQLTGLPASYTNTNVSTFLASFGSNSINTTGNVTAAYLIGNASALTGTIANANYAAYAGNVINGAQSNITSVGTLQTTTLAANANIAMSGTLSQIAGANLVSANYFTGTLTTAAQPNITSVGTLNGLTGSGTINLTTASNVSLGPVGNVHITGGSPGYVLSTDGSGTLTWAAQTGGGGSVTASQYVVKGTLSSNQSLNNGADTLVAWDTKSFDPQNWLNTTSHFVTPTIAGYYKVTFNAWFTQGTSSAGAQYNIQIHKSATGSGTTAIAQQPIIGTNAQTSMVSDTVYMNGTTDYFAFTAYSSIASQSLQYTNGTFFTVELIGAASATSNIGNANSNVNIASANANVTISVNNTTNVAVFANTGVTVNGNITTSANSNINVGGELVVNNYNQHGGTGYAGIITMTNSGGGTNPNKFVRLNSTGSLEIINSAYSATIFTLTDAGTLTVPGNVSGSYILGNGSQLTGTIANANYAAYAGNVINAAQPNITSVGTLVNTTMGSSNSLTGGNLVSASYLTGTLTTAAQPNITSVGTLVNTTMGASNSLTGGNLVSANYFTGTLTTGAQPNITSVGTLTTLNVTGNVTASYVIGNGSQLTGVVANANYAAYAGNVINASQGNITSVGTLTSLNVSANVSSGGNLIAAANVIASNANLGNLAVANYFSGSGNLLSNIQGANVSGAVASATTAATVTTGAQPNITSVGSLTSLSITNDLTVGGNLLINGTVTTIHSTTVSVDDLAIEVAKSATTAAQANGAGIIINGASANMLYNSTSNAFVFSHKISADGGLLSNIAGANVTGTVTSATSATTAQTVTTGAQPNITSVGTLTGLAVSGGVSAQYFLGPVANGQSNVSIPVMDGNVNIVANGNTSLTVTSTGAKVTGNLTTTGNITASYLIGNGSQLTGLPASYTNTNVSTFLASFGSNSISTTGTVTAGNITSTANIQVGQYVTTAGATDLMLLPSTQVTRNYGNLDPYTGGYYLGGGSRWDGIRANTGDFAGDVVVAGNITINGEIIAPNIAGTSDNVTITAGTFVSKFDTTGNVTLANNAIVLGNATAQYFVGNGAYLTGLPASYTDSNVATYLPTHTGNVGANNVNASNVYVSTLTSGQLAIASTGGKLVGGPDLVWDFANSKLAITNIGATGNITANKFIGNGSLLTNINGSNVTSQVGNALVAGTVYTAAQPAITSLGTLTGLTVNGVTTLGSAANIKISGGSAGYVLTTDGTGNLSWGAAGSGGGATSFVAISKDQFTADGSTSSYTLSTVPVSKNAIEVIIDGIQQISDTYTLTGSTVTFSGNVPTGQIVEITVFGVASLSGSIGEVQYNNGGEFGSSSSFTYNSTSDTLSVGNVSTSGNITSSGGQLSLAGAPIAVDSGSGSAGIFNLGSVSNLAIGLSANVTFGSTSGTVTARGTLKANNLGVSSYYSTRDATTVTTNTVIDQFPVSTYRSAKYTMRVNSDGGYQAVEVLLVHDGSSSFVTIYGSISSSGSDIVSLTSDISAGNVRLIASTVSTNTTVRILGTYVQD